MRQARIRSKKTESPDAAGARDEMPVPRHPARAQVSESARPRNPVPGSGADHRNDLVPPPAKEPADLRAKESSLSILTLGSSATKPAAAESKSLGVDVGFGHYPGLEHEHHVSREERHEAHL